MTFLCLTVVGSTASAQTVEVREDYTFDLGNPNLGYGSRTELVGSAGERTNDFVGGRLRLGRGLSLETGVETEYRSLTSGGGARGVEASASEWMWVDFLGERRWVVDRTTVFASEPYERQEFFVWRVGRNRERRRALGPAEIRGGAGYVERKLTLDGVVVEQKSTKRGFDLTEEVQASVGEALATYEELSGGSTSLTVGTQTLANRALGDRTRTFTLGPVPVTVTGTLSISARLEGLSLEVEPHAMRAELDDVVSIGPSATLSASIDTGMGHGDLVGRADYATVTFDAHLALDETLEPEGHLVVTRTELDLLLALWVETFWKEYSTTIYRFEAETTVLYDNRF